MKRAKAWLTNEIEIMGSETSENYPHEQMVGREVVLNLIDQLDEPEKVVIPRFVAEQLEYWKRNKMNILWQFFLREIPSSMLSWLESDAGNYDKLIDAENNGYEVEEEQKYYVLLGNQSHDDNWTYALTNSGSIEVFEKDVLPEWDRTKLTETEIKDYDERFWPFAVEVEG